MVPDPAGAPLVNPADPTPYSSVNQPADSVQPAQNPSPNLPSPTQAPNTVTDPPIVPPPSPENPNDTPNVPAMPTGANLILPPVNPQGTQKPNNKPDDPTTPTAMNPVVPPANPQGSQKPNDKPDDPATPTGMDPTPPPAGPQDSPKAGQWEDPGKSADPDSPGEPHNAATATEGSQNPGLGGFIYNALGEGAPNDPDVPKPMYFVAGQAFTANPTGFQIAGLQVLPGQSPVTISGTRVSLNSNGLLNIVGSSIQLSAPTAAPRVGSIRGNAFTADSNGVHIGGVSLTPGGSPVTVSGTPIVLSSNSILHVGGATTDLSNPSTGATAITVGPDTLTPNAHGFAISGSSLLPGGPVMTVSGTPLSLDQSGGLYIGTFKTQLPYPNTNPDVATIGENVLTAKPSGFLIAGSSVLPGGQAITISGTPVSLAPSGVLFVGSSSFTIPSESTASSTALLGGLTFTYLPSSAVDVDGSSLNAGAPATTVDGEKVSLGLNGELVVGTVSTQLPTSIGLNTTGNEPIAFEGKQPRSFELPPLLLLVTFSMAETVLLVI